MAAYSENIIDIIERLLVDENGLKVIGRGISMMKVLTRKSLGEEDYDFQQAPDDFQEFMWMREIRNIPFQQNVIMKSVWQRTKDFG